MPDTRVSARFAPWLEVANLTKQVVSPRRYTGGSSSLLSSRLSAFIRSNWRGIRWSIQTTVLPSARCHRLY